jgi:hypothetical protein
MKLILSFLSRKYPNARSPRANTTPAKREVLPPLNCCYSIRQSDCGEEGCAEHGDGHPERLTGTYSQNYDGQGQDPDGMRHIKPPALRSHGLAVERNLLNGKTARRSHGWSPNGNSGHLSVQRDPKIRFLPEVQPHLQDDAMHGGMRRHPGAKKSLMPVRQRS